MIYSRCVRNASTAQRKGYTVTNLVASREARQKFFELVRSAHSGNPAVITIDGIPVAAIVGYEHFRRWYAMDELPATNVSDLERHALALAAGDTDRAALLLSEALTRMLGRRTEKREDDKGGLGDG